MPKSIGEYSRSRIGSPWTLRDHARLIEALFAVEKMEELLSDIAPPRDEVFVNLVKDVRAGRIVPVFVGSAEHGNGITRLLKALRHETADIGDTRARLNVKDGTDAIVQVVKTI